MKILSCIESYLPGQQGGGPVRALHNLVKLLGDEYTFSVFTRHRDYLCTQPYDDLPANQWTPLENSQVYYAKDKEIDSLAEAEILKQSPDWIYLNGAFPPLTRALLQRRRRNPILAKIPVLLAPHGNFGPASMVHHALRKRLWLAYAKARGLYQGVIWHAASEREAAQIRSLFGNHASIRIVPMAPTPISHLPYPISAPEVLISAAKLQHPISHIPATGGSHLRLIYFGRLSAEKNISFALELLREFSRRHPETKVTYDLYHLGETDHHLKQQAQTPPANVQVNFIPGLSHEELQARIRGQPPVQRGLRPGGETPAHRPSTTDHNAPSAFVPLSPKGHPPSSPSTSLRANPTGSPSPRCRAPSAFQHFSFSAFQLFSTPYSALLMPSLTENFSYTVLESLQAGIPVLISDQTPWRNLTAEGIGWDLPLDDQGPWLTALETLTDPNKTTPLRQRAFAYADNWIKHYPEKARKLFEK